ncbi:hypothetical protein FHS95_003798 [Sphingomonas naasensis]|uniref:Uncharacterized protein n=1 Tax=Sphingomonas naasensis TaxID=1344951 RepID=A0A4S1WKE2_9SPHN|nr:hypothetical protein [Sphingomonas naasensis]NIJ22087.1 hypothetical protein [Sphingomonas naasensis]TGX42240.1 hypothetical protein E5A74_10295 [Sphingomonas naasensis]
MAAGLLGLASASIPFVSPDHADEAAWLLLGATAAVIGLGAALTLTMRMRRMRSLHAGKGVIARWRVEPALWARFVADDRDAERDGRKRNNAIRLRSSPDGAVEVIVGDDCLQIDGDFHPVPLAEFKGAGMSAGPPSVLELRFVTPRPQQSDLHYAFRFPVALGAEAAAQQVIDHYDRRYRAKYGAY